MGFLAGARNGMLYFKDLGEEAAIRTKIRMSKETHLANRRFFPHPKNMTCHPEFLYKNFAHPVLMIINFVVFLHSLTASCISANGLFTSAVPED